MTLFGNTTGAEFSPCGTYRYKLWRIWDDTMPKAMCIGLNPSKANSEKDDNTISVLSVVLWKLGYGGFYMVNLFAFISAYPKDLLTCADPMGDNETKIQEVAQLCDDVIFCWGTFKQAADRAKQVIPNYPAAKCFGQTKNGSPIHPRGLIYIKDGLKYPKLTLYEN